jgi:peroxiredoxin
VAIGLVVGRIVLFAVFLVAGFAKLVDRKGSREALVGLGVNTGLAAPLGTLLPLAEIAVAGLLVPVASVWLGAIGAFAMLLTFTGVIAFNVMRGRTPNCHCFGQLHSEPAGPSTLARNAALACVAGFLAWQAQTDPGPSLLRWIGDLGNSERLALLSALLGLVLLLGQSALLLQVLKQQGRILVRLDAMDASDGGGIAVTQPQPVLGLAVGSVAPEFRLDGLEGESQTLSSLLSEQKPVLLLFTNPRCGPCEALLVEVGRWQRELSSVLTIAIISEGTIADNHKSAERSLSHVLLQQKREAAELYQSWGTPGAVLVRSGGFIGSPLAQGAEAIRTLVARSVGGAHALQLVPTASAPANNRLRAFNRGDPAPPITLRNLGGKTVSLTAFRGRKTLLLFWNPGCGFCQRMLTDLVVWETSRPRGAPALAVVSIGSADEGRQMGLSSPVLLDASRQAAAAFGASGTPMAILLDGEGRIDSEVAAGAQAIFALAAYGQID